MAYRNKAECERYFTEYILSVGIEDYGKTYDSGNWYWFFNLKNETRRYWTNLSEDNQKLLGVNL